MRSTFPQRSGKNYLFTFQRGRAVRAPRRAIHSVTKTSKVFFLFTVSFSSQAFIYLAVEIIIGRVVIQCTVDDC